MSAKHRENICPSVVRLSPTRVSTFSEDATVTAAAPGRYRASHMVRALDGTAESTR